MPDDFDASVATLGSVAVGTPTNGSIETIGDQDWFAVTLVEGRQYSVLVSGFYSPGTNTLTDPYLRGIYDAQGVYLGFSDSDDADLAERLGNSTLIAGYSGTHYIAASGYGTATGTYSVSVTDLGIYDDYSADILTTGNVDPGFSAFGTLEVGGDSDWFEAYLLAGYTYRFELFGTGTGSWATANDLILAPLRDANGTIIPNTGESGGNGGFILSPVESYFEYTPLTTGYYFVDALSHEGSTGRYQLDLTDLGPAFDDWTEGPTQPGLVFVGSSIEAAIDYDGDVDWISVDFVAGNTYEISLRGADTFDGSLEFVNLEYMIDPFGFEIPYAFNGGASGGNSSLRFLATETDTHQLAVSSYDGYVGSYTVFVDNLFIFDDYADNPSTDGVLLVNDSVSGIIDSDTDYDFFRVSLNAGTIYQFDMTSFDSLDPYIDGIYSYAWNYFYNHPDNYISGTDNDDFGVALDSRITFTAPTTGDYFISVGSADFTTGDYELSLITVGTAPDDFGGNSSTLGTLAVGNTVNGVNENELDRDWFRITLDAGSTYRFAFEAPDSYLADFDAPIVRVHNQFGSQINSTALEYTNYNETSIVFSPVTSGTYFVAVGDSFSTNGTGAYQISAEFVGFTDDYAANTGTTGVFSIMGSPTTYVVGDIEQESDEDWFAVNLTQGHRYNINLKGSETGVGSLFDPFFRGVYDSSGVLLGSSDDDSGEGLNSFASFVAAYTGTHYFSAGAAASEGGNTGLYVLQYDDLGLDDIAPTLTDINEGETLQLEYTFEDFGISRDVAFDWDITALIQLGTATAADFVLNSVEDFDSLNIDLTATDDALVEDDETLIFEVTGYIDYIGPVSGSGGSTFMNVDGDDVFGEINRYEFTQLLSFTINSAPEGSPAAITNVQFNAPGVIGNALTTFADGSGESFSVVPTTFGGAISGEILANGDIFLSGASGAPGASVMVPFAVIDIRGALTFSNQTITLADLTDDYLPGPAASAFGSIDVNSTELGIIETDGDRDRFEVTLQAGVAYEILLQGASSLTGTLIDPQIIGVFDGQGLLVERSGDNDSGVGTDARVQTLFVPFDGTYQIEVASASDIGTGDYALTVTQLDLTDDFLPGDLAGQFGTVRLGTPTTGEIDFAGDEDWFATVLLAGRQYEIQLRGEPSSDGTLDDPLFVGVYDLQGAFLGGANDDASSGNANSLSTFTAGYSGVHFFAAGGATGETQSTGTYTLEFIDLGPVESNLVAEETLNEGEDLTLNITYDIPTGITPPFPGTGSPNEFVLNNALVVDISVEGDLNASDIAVGYALGETHVLSFNALDDALVEDDEIITVDISGYLDWIVPNSQGQTYTNVLGGTVVGFLERTFVDFSVAITINSAPEGAPTPIEGFVFTGPQVITNVLTTFEDGEEEQFSVLPATFEADGIVGTLLANGDLSFSQLDVPSGQSIVVNFTVEDARGAQTLGQQLITIGTPPDDYLPGDTATALGSAVVGSPSLGNIETVGDRDRFTVTLQAGVVYDISLEGQPTSAGSLVNPQIIGLFDSLGALVSGTSDDDSGVGANALVTALTVAADGVYEIEVGSSSDLGTGDYALTVSQLGLVDDFLPGPFAGALGSVAVDTPTTGTLETDGDRDRFTVTLQAGHIYDIALEGASTSGGSLADPRIIGLFNSLGTLVTGSSDDNSGVGGNALVNGLTVAADGTYQIEVASSTDIGIGDYTLSVNFTGFVDDFLPGISDALGAVTVGGQTIGEIETSGDIDGFRVFLQADTTYEIGILGLDSNNGTLVDPDLLGIFTNSALSGAPLSSVQTLNTQIVGDDSVSYFTPQSAGEYFIGVRDAFGGLGTYTVAVQDIGVRDDYSADTDTMGTIAPGSSAVGRIDYSQDSDWFEVNLSANRLYEIELVPLAGGNALADPFFNGVYTSSGVLIQNTSNDDGGEGTSSALQFVADAPGTYYLAAAGFGDNTGQYRLVLNDLGPLDDNRFDITLQFTSDNVSNAYIQAFEDAVERWQEIITGDLPYAFVEGYGFVDDILIEVAIEDLELTFEGVNQTILAISSVLDQRSDSSSGAGALPSYSRIVINQQEVGTLLNLDEFVANTIGRALGFGSLWEEFGLVQDINGVATYTGSNALREMAELSGDLNGVNALEDGGNGGLAGEYWSEAVFNAELMTSRVELRRPASGEGNPNIPDNPISALTIAAMQDLGYQVDYGAADRYVLPSGALARQASAERTSGDTGVTQQSAVAQRLVSELPNNQSIPNGTAFIYARQNSLSEQPASFPLTPGNSEVVSATGTNAVFLEGVTGENYLVELKGTFQKNNPATVSDLSGTVDSMEVRSLTGLLLFSVDYTQRPVPVTEVIAQWPNHSIDDDNVVIVDSAVAGSVVRINPNGGDAAESRIFVGAGDDYVRGGAASELINGGADNDTLLGQDGADTLVGGTGNDSIDGGSGIDTAAYSGAQSAYTLTLSPGMTTLQDRRADGNGLDSLHAVEFLDFDTDVLGGPFDLRIFGGPTALSAPDFESFIELYIAYFNRAPDAIGLNFWGTAFANGTTLVQMAALFGPQDETRAAYPLGTSNEVFATTVYNNVLGRTPDQGGIDFWVGQLDSEDVSRDQFILSVLQGAKSAEKPDLGEDFVAQQRADRAYLENKIDIGAYYAVHKGMSDVGNAVAAMALFDGTQDGITAAVAAIDGFHMSALDAENGAFLMPLVGVLDDPFATM